jgi:hypothetical protein
MTYDYTSDEFEVDYSAYLKATHALHASAPPITEADFGLVLAAKYPANEASTKARLACRMRAYILSHSISHAQLKTIPSTPHFRTGDNAFAALYPDGVARDFDAPTILTLEAKARKIESLVSKNPAG